MFQLFKCVMLLLMVANYKWLFCTVGEMKAPAAAVGNFNQHIFYFLPFYGQIIEKKKSDYPVMTINSISSLII